MTPAPTRVTLGERVYRGLLRAYPRAFRDRYADDLVAFYRERIAAARTPGAAVRVWWQLVPDLCASALAERFAWLQRDLDRAPRIERVHSTRREQSMSILSQDLRYAVRSMRLRPVFTAVVLATLALGIGTNTAIFTIVDTVLFRPLPYPQPDRLVDFAHADPYSNVSEMEFVDYQRGMTALGALAAYGDNTVTLDVGDQALRVRTMRVSRDFFGILGVPAVTGRTFTADEFAPASTARPVVISHALWQQEFAGDPRAIGRSMLVNGERHVVVGVMPPSFAYPDETTQAWFPWRLDLAKLQTRNNHYLRLVGRIASGATLAQVRAQARALDAKWMRDFPDIYPAKSPLTAKVTLLPEHLVGRTRPYLLALLGAVGFVLLIACANVANLLLARQDTRRKELAIRAALGASRGRVVRQLLTESLVLAAGGAVLGVLMAVLGVRTLRSWIATELPRVQAATIDYRVIAFAIAITLVTGLIFGLAPAMQGTSGGNADVLREGGKTSASGGSSALRRTLVVAEVALAVIMSSGAGLLVRSLINLQAVPLGFDPSRVMTMELTLPAHAYSDTTAKLFFDRLVTRVRALPGVRSAAAVDALPISGSDNEWSIMLDGRVVTTVADAATARPEFVTPGYLETMHIPIVRGRGLTADDRADGAPVAVISEGLARELWPGLDPIGHTIRMFAGDHPWVRVVGVAADARERGFEKGIPATMYIPYAQSNTSSYLTPRSMTLVVRTAHAPASVVAGVRSAVRAMDPRAPIDQVASMTQVVGDSIASRRLATTLLAAFALLALLLAGIGIYGVIAYGVAQRRYEIGVRLAMGATPAAIVRMVVDDGVRLTALGFIVGLGGALAVDRLLGAMLVGVASTDLVTVLGTTLCFAAVAACALALPARRATTVSPTEALRLG